MFIVRVDQNLTGDIDETTYSFIRKHLICV